MHVGKKGILSRLVSLSPKLRKDLKNLLGFRPGNLALYEVALSHRSSREKPDENNERLEYLGDAVLGAIIGDFLFKKYPYKDEGYLTEMRSKIVNRQQLNDIAIKMGLRKLTIYNKNNNFLKISSIFGNTLEALVGGTTPSRMERMEAMASTAPAAPSRWPVMDLVELMLSL